MPVAISEGVSAGDARCLTARVGKPAAVAGAHGVPEETMSGRRRHSRFAPAEPWEGVVTVLHDVIVQGAGSGGLVAFSQVPGVLDEVLTLDIAGGGERVTVRVQVEESRPVLLDGSVRHRLALRVLEGYRRPESTGSAAAAAGVLSR